MIEVLAFLAASIATLVLGLCGLYTAAIVMLAVSAILLGKLRFDA